MAVQWVDSLENTAPTVFPDNCKAHINPDAEVEKVRDSVGRDSIEAMWKYKPPFNDNGL